jgi:hypothetical protein
LGDPLKGNLLLFYKPLHLEAQQVSIRIEVRRHQWEAGGGGDGAGGWGADRGGGGCVGTLEVVREEKERMGRGCACGVGSGGATVQVRALAIFLFTLYKDYPHLAVNCAMVVNGTNVSRKEA